MKFSTHLINSKRAKIEFSCTNCFREIVALGFALATAQSKFFFRSLRNKMINLVLVIRYQFDFRLRFDIDKKFIFEVLPKSCLVMVRATTWHNFLSSDQLPLETYEFYKCTISLKMYQQLRIVDFVFNVIPLVFSKFDKLVRQI